MPEIDQLDIRQMAEACVSEMGDIFWDQSGGSRDPHEVATETIEAALIRFADKLTATTPHFLVSASPVKR